jgi:hypothetical protein
LFQQYKDRVAFYIVYIAEAHPSDLWQMESNVKAGVVFANPATTGDREKIANSCVRNLHIPIPALIDSIQNNVEQEYTGWPDRLYLIDANGRIQFKTEAGPFGFDAKALANALRSLPLNKQ